MASMGDNCTRRSDYKKTIIGTYNKAGSRALRAETRTRQRHSNRANAFSRNRNLEDASDDTVLAKNARLLRLLKWKKEKEKEKVNDQKVKKPEFKCGRVHHEDSYIYRDIKPQQLTKKVILQTPLAPVNYKFKPPNGIGHHAIKITIPISPKVLSKSKIGTQLKKTSALNGNSILQPPVTRSKQQKLNMHHMFPEATDENGPSTSGHIVSGITKHNPVELTRLQRKARTNSSYTSLQEINKVTAMNNDDCDLVPIEAKDISKEMVNRSNLELSKNICTTSVCPTVPQHSPGLKSVISPDSNRAVVTPDATANSAVIAEDLPVSNSPFLTYSRGKQCSFRRSQKIEAAETDANETEKRQRTTKYFRNMLNEEVDRLKGMCKEWTAIQTTAETDIPADVDELIDLAVGQSNLLISQKLTQFRGLVEHYGKGTGQHKVTVPDLQGFWDMVYIQVENIDLHFKKLDFLRKNEWKNPTSHEIEATKPVTRSKKAGANKAKPVAKAQSILRAAIEAARKKNRLADIDNAKENDSLEPSKVLKTPDNPRLHSILKSANSSRLSTTPVNPVVFIVSQMAKSIGSSEKMNSSKNISKSSTKGILRTKNAARKSVIFQDLVDTNETEKLEIVSHNDIIDQMEDDELSTTSAPTITPLTENSICRRSARLTKRVQFQGDNLANTPKPTLQVTPHSKRRSARPSLLGTNMQSPGTPLECGDLISWDSPLARPLRSSKRLK